MKRDMDLVRSLLVEIEKLPFDGSFHDVSVPGRSEEEISYHILLMKEAGLIEATDLSSMDGVCWKPVRLTNDGHEFLEAARNDNLWSNAKQRVISTAGDLTIEGLKIALSVLVRQALGAGV